MTCKKILVLSNFPISFQFKHQISIDLNDNTKAEIKQWLVEISEPFFWC